jgi:hypothetical protein
MDALITAAARALATGDMLGALQRVALRDDPPALALRGIAMAQLGEYPRAHALLRRAARGFGTHEVVARARCIVAQAEVALAMRALQGSWRTLPVAADALQARGDHANAAQARLIAVRRLLLLGRLDAAAQALDALDAAALPLALQAMAALAAAELALRALQVGPAQAALLRAREAAEQARVPALQAEVAAAFAMLEQPVARCLQRGEEQPLRLDQVARLHRPDTLIVDACRHGLRVGDHWLSLARRPLLFTLARALAEAWPGDLDRHRLIARAFRTRDQDETHRARLRVELARLRALAAPWARIEASANGFALRPLQDRQVVVLAPPIDGEPGALLALLDDGAPWSTSALALALGDSQRTVQRTLATLEQAGRVRSIGAGRAQRWLAPPCVGFSTVLLLPTLTST